MRRFRDYDPFAWLYANYWGDSFHRAVVPVLERVVLSELPPRAAVLDLCCGDGRLASALEQSGFRVTGIDGSEKMLAFARQRARKTRFLLADARTFRLPPQFDAVLSTFDSLNHVMKSTELCKVFRNVWRCLKPGGVFLFDLNREEAYLQLWVRNDSDVERGMVGVSRGSYKPETRMAVCDITLMRLEDGLWRRLDFQMRQRWHPRDMVVEALEALGFKTCVYDAGELGMQGDVGYGRDFYRAHKP